MQNIYPNLQGKRYKFQKYECIMTRIFGKIYSPEQNEMKRRNKTMNGDDKIYRNILLYNIQY